MGVIIAEGGQNWSHLILWWEKHIYPSRMWVFRAWKYFTVSCGSAPAGADKGEEAPSRRKSSSFINRALPTVAPGVMKPKGEDARAVVWVGSLAAKAWYARLHLSGHSS